MLINLFIIWLVLIPFLVWDGYFEGPKILVFLLGGFVLSFYWILRLTKNQNTLKLGKKDLWFWVWLLVLIISSLFGIHPQESVLGGSYRHQGVIFFLVLWLIGKTTELLEGESKRLLYKGMGLAVMVEVLIVFYQIIFGKLYLGLPLGTLGEVNAVAGFLAIGVYFVFISYPKVFSSLPLIAIVLMQSKSGVLALLSNLGFQINLMGKRTRVFVAGLCLLSVIFLFFKHSTAKDFSFFENRQTIWPMAVQQIVKKPFLGYGAESGEVVFNNAFRASGFPLSGLIIDRAHNLFLDIAMWSGVTGLVAFSLWLYFSFVSLKDVGRKMAALSFLIFSMFQPLGVVHWILLFLIL
jgi:hypothetical protein